MAEAPTDSGVEVVALSFLAAYWRGDLSAALEFCTPTATMELPASIPIPTPERMARLLPVVFSRVYPRFVGSRFDVEVDRVIARGALVVVEYIATGRLVEGGDFRCRYAMVIETDGDKIAWARAYTDTRYVAERLMPNSTVPGAKPAGAPS